VIPATVTYDGQNYSVTSIGSSAFRGCSGLTSVNIPNSVTSIRLRAFYGCSGLTSVDIPNSVTSIGADAFRRSSGLTSVTIPNSVTSIGNSAFRSCGCLRELVIEDGTTTFDLEGNSLFYDSPIENLYLGRNLNCGSYSPFRDKTTIKKLSIGNLVTSIGEDAFYGCSGLTSVDIPNSVTSIGEDAFYGCIGLASVDIPNSVTSIGDRAFYGCSGLASVDIPNSVTSIGGGAFIGCSGLTSVDIPNSVTSIGGAAFSGCSGLTSIIIPSSVTSIGSFAFGRCSSLTSVVIEDGTTTLDLQHQTLSTDQFYDCPIETLYLGRNLNYYYYASSPFKDKTTLKKVSIGNLVTSIGGGVFYGCSGLEGVYISDLAAWCNIEFSTGYLYNSFYYANPLSYAHHLYLNGEEIKDLIIPDSITSIGAGAFYGCSGLTSVTIPNSVTSIGREAFDGCSGLEGVYISDLAAWCDIEFCSYGSNPLENAHHLYLNGEVLTDLVIPDSVTSIGSWAFYGCSDLTSVTIPNSVTSIGNYAFGGCSALTSVDIPNSITSIGGAAFIGCNALEGVYISDLAAWCNIEFGNYYNNYSNDGNPLSYAHHLYLNGEELTDLVIPDSVTSIGDYAFYGCSGLTSVTIPNSATSIGSCAFYGCSGLASVDIPNSVTEIGGFAFYETSWYDNQKDGLLYINNLLYCYKGTMPENTSIEIKEGTVSICGYAFEDCSGLASVTIPNSVTSIGESAFYGCSGLTSVTIPNSVTSIGENAFYDCSGLTSVTIGKSVNSIGFQAFLRCDSLKTITSLNSTPPTIASRYTIFTDTQYETVEVYVPTGSLSAYKTADVWKNFLNIKELGTTGIEEVTANGNKPNKIYDLNGRPLNAPKHGLNIINGKKVYMK